jgi:polygalacturonase
MASTILNVRDFGAVGDGVAFDTDAINRAITNAEPGSTVRLPAGIYLSYSIRLRSHLTLLLDRGATLLAAGDPPPSPEKLAALLTAEGHLPGGGRGDSSSFYAGDTFGLDDPPPPTPSAEMKRSVTPLPKKSAERKHPSSHDPRAPGYDPPEHNPHDKYQDYGHSHWHNSLIWGEKLENVAITGEGMIDGRGLTWNADPDHPTGNKAVAFKNCRNVRLSDVTIFRGGQYAVLASGCVGVSISNLRIDTNRDGIDIDTCQSVSITDCLINSPNDDAIALKSSLALHATQPTEDVTIRHCHVFGYDLGTLLDGTRQTTQKTAPDGGGVMGRIKLGTESNGGFRKIVISDCSFAHCRGLALEAVDGGTMEDIAVSHLTMNDVTSAPLFIRLGDRARGPAGSPTSTVRRVAISHVEVNGAEPRFASILAGIPGRPIDGVQLSDIRITYRGGGGKKDAAAQPPEKEGAYPEPHMFGVIPAYGLYCRHVRNLYARNVSVAFEKDDQRPPVILEDVHSAAFDKFQARRLSGGPMFSLRYVRDIRIETDQAKGLHIASLESGQF